jgi:hypothetical protein
MTVAEALEEYGFGRGVREDGTRVLWYVANERDDCGALRWARVLFVGTDTAADEVDLADLLAPDLSPDEVARAEGYDGLEAWFADVRPLA